MYYDKVTKNHW